MEYKYLQEPLETYIERVSEKSPCPGGGSASILSLAIANALTIMVCNFSMESRRISKESQKISKDVFNAAGSIQSVLNKSIEEDSRIYEMIQEKMRKLKKNPDKVIEYENALLKSIELHMKMLDYCEQILTWNEQLVENSNPYLISDIGVSSSLVEGALRAIRINILVNLYEIKNRDYVLKVENMLEKTSPLLIGRAKNIISIVERKMKTGSDT